MTTIQIKIWNISIILKTSSYLPANTTYQSWGNHYCHFYHYRLVLPDFENQVNGLIQDRLLLLKMMSLRIIQVAALCFTCFYCCMIFHRLHHILFTCSSGYLEFRHIMNEVAKNTYVLLSFWIYAISSFGINLGVYFLALGRSLLILSVLQGACTILSSRQQCIRVQLLYILGNTWNSQSA